MGGSKSKLYMTLDEQDCAAADAEGLKSAMAGLGTNEADLITDLAFKNDRHLSLVKKIFNEKYGKQGNLQKWIEDDTSGDFKDLLLAMAADEPEVIADALYKAMKGIGTDDDLLMYTLSTRSPTQLERAKEVFQRKYPGENLEKWIMDDTSGDFMKILVALADKNLYYCKVLNKAITSGDEDELISILVSLKHHDEIKRIVSNFADPIGYASDLIGELENEFSNPTLKEIAASYERLYGVPLLNAIRKETSGKFEKLIMGLLGDHSLRDAEYIRKACSGAGTDEARLIQIFVTRGEKDRENLSRAYMGAYGKSITDEIISETSDRFRDTLLNLAKPKGVVLAEALHKAIHGLGTDERAVITLLVHRSRKELREMAVAYKNLYQKDVIQAVADDTSGWFRRALTFLLKESTAPKRRMFISKKLLIAPSEV